MLFRIKSILGEGVSDGDTLAVTNTRSSTVRFSCVDAPEVPHSTKERNTKKKHRDQFKWGVKAQARVKQLVEQGDRGL